MSVEVETVGRSLSLRARRVGLMVFAAGLSVVLATPAARAQETCNPALGVPGECDDDNVCTVDVCDPVLGCVHDTTAVNCDDSDPCTADTCDPSQGCVHAPAPEGVPECTPPCRVTGGGLVYMDTHCLSEPCVVTDPSILAEIQHASFSGQVSAPYGDVGCASPAGLIQGQWTHLRHRHRGSLHASDYNSFACGCADGTSGGSAHLDGLLCPVDPESNPEPRRAAANIACWSGTGDFRPRNGNHTLRVAFRVEVEDRGEPGGGQNAGSLDDVYWIRIWVPRSQEDVDVLARQVCCRESIPNIRHPDFYDGGNLLHGNINIHAPSGNDVGP